MAFVATSLSPLSTNSVGPKLWSYNTDESAGFVKGVNYFLPAFRHLKVGDFILFESGPGNLITMDCIVVVTVCSSTTVTTAGKSVDL